MSLRWSSYVALKSPPKGSQKCKTADLRKKIGLRLKKVCYKVSLCENCQRQSCKAFISLTNRAKMICGGGATPCTWNFGSKWPRWCKIVDFRSIFARSASAITPSEKSSINANRKSTMRFPMSLRWSWYVAPKSPKGGLKNAKRPICVKKSDFAWRKSATEFLCVKTVSGKVVRHSLA